MTDLSNPAGLTIFGVVRYEKEIRFMRSRKIKRFAKQLEREGEIFGFEFDDLIVGRSTIRGEGDFAGIADTDLLISFDKKGSAKQFVLGTDYYAFNGRLVQNWQFSNYKKYSRSITSSKYEDKYAKATNYLGNGTERGLQRGIDLIEEIPGIGNLAMQLFNYDSGRSQYWT